VTSSKHRDHDSQLDAAAHLHPRMAVSWSLTTAAIVFVIGIMTYGGYRPPAKVATVPQLASASGNSAGTPTMSIPISISSDAATASDSGR
jgi:hypothetical protein